MKNYEITVVGRVNKEWGWRVRTMNGRTIGASSEGYKNRMRAVRNCQELTGFPLEDIARANRGAFRTTYRR